MLLDLYMLDSVFSGPDNTVFEADLIAQFGEREVSEAIANGLLEHRRLPFREGRQRCICWLSDEGRKMAHTQSQISAHISF